MKTCNHLNIQQKGFIDGEAIPHASSLPVLSGRADFIEKLSLHSAQLSQNGRALIVVDFDCFRDIVGRFGCESGEAVLVLASEKIAATLRHSDFAARLEADEFHLYICDLLSADAAISFGLRLKDSLCGVWQVRGSDIYVSVSVGVVYSDADVEAHELLRRGSAALRRAKTQGKNSVYLYEDGLEESLFRRFTLERGLHQALEKDEFYLCYQPIVEARTGKLAGLEGLLRWHSSALGDISPAEFIPAAEESGMIIPIGMKVIERICAQRREWDERGYGKFFVAANISPVQLQQEGFGAQVLELLNRHGVSRSSVEFEVTESVSMESMSNALESLRRIRDHGISVSLDDFGTGYSSLARLKNLPIDRIKIDKSFVDDIGVNSCSEAVISGTIHMAKRMGLCVIAEGVETMTQADYLAEAGADCLQGYLFSRPVRGEDMDDLLKDNRISLERDSCYYYQI